MSIIYSIYIYIFIYMSIYILIVEAPIFWPPDANSQLIEKSDAGKD